MRHDHRAPPPLKRLATLGGSLALDAGDPLVHCTTTGLAGWIGVHARNAFVAAGSVHWRCESCDTPFGRHLMGGILLPDAIKTGLDSSIFNWTFSYWRSGTSADLRDIVASFGNDIDSALLQLPRALLPGTLTMGL